MGRLRKVQSVSRSVPTIEGAGVRLKRAFGRADPSLDPFLLLDDFHSDNPRDYLAGFPWHPHRGIETITYVLEGQVAHGDSLRNQGMIRPGDVQWMTAGSGIIHQEMPEGDEENRLWGFQLWANLPARNKMMPPRYREVPGESIPEVELEGSRVKVICGELDGVGGPVSDIVTDPTYLDVTVPAGGQLRLPVPQGHNAFAYVVEGQGRLGPGEEGSLGAEHLVVFSDGDEIQAAATGERLRFLLVAGRPINEPVAWQGPIVMNTEEELRVAFDEYHRGTFIKDH